VFEFYLLVLIVAVIGVSFYWFKTWRVKTYFRRNGITVDGRIIDRRKEEHWSRYGKEYDYYLMYSYEYQGTTYQQEEPVSNEDYHAYHNGTRVSVRCLSADPTIARLWISEEPLQSRGFYRKLGNRQQSTDEQTQPPTQR